MKVEQPGAGFRPVVITLESLKEVAAIERTLMAGGTAMDEGKSVLRRKCYSASSLVSVSYEDVDEIQSSLWRELTRIIANSQHKSKDC